MRYRVGQTIPSSGIYTVLHKGHRQSHEVTLLKGDAFPRCARCGDAVKFVLVKAAAHLEAHPFAIHLYEIPDLDGVIDSLPSK